MSKNKPRTARRFKMIAQAHNNLIRNTINSYSKKLNVIISNELQQVYKNDLVIFDYETEQELLSFLLGLDCVFDNKNLWGLK